MKYIDADKLKKIVEQAKQRALKGVEVDGDYYCDGRADAFGEVLLEIDVLQQEQPAEGLEEEISRTYRDGSVTDTSDIDHVSYENIARHFAEWGAEHAQK